MRRPTGKTLTLDLLSTLGGRSMPIATLVAAAELFGIAEGSLRVAVTRLLAEGRIERDERGRYRLGPAAAAVDRQVRRWRRLEERTRRWNGAWIAVHGAPVRPRAAEARAAARALRWQGFRELVPGLSVRPDNLRGGVDGTRRALRELGLPPAALVMRLAELDPEREREARGLWDVEALLRSYRRSLRLLERSEERLARADVATGMVESFELGGQVIRQLVEDPLLPEELIPVEPRRRLVHAMRRYDRCGRRLWSGFMEGHGAPAVRAPVHTEGGAALPAALGAPS